MLFALARVFAEEAARIPLVRLILTPAYKRKFDTATGHVRLFHGIYPDFPSASRDIPAGRLEGFDNEATVLRLADERFRICASDYPIMFWLQKLLPECKLLFDFGGNVGISYFGYRKYMEYPSGLSWLVSDVPAVAALGMRIAQEEAASNLRFTTSLTELPRADILLAAGSLQFIEKPFELLRSVAALPRHILVNKVPLLDLPTAVTLHNMGSAMCPYHLFNRAEFLAGFRALEYEMVAEWETDLSARIPLYHQYSVRTYVGFYFRKAL
jgi:putative methyltransferase (TIGR04325 family)